MKRLVLSGLLLGLLLAACLPRSTPTPAPTITPGPISTAEPTPGNLEVKVLDSSDPAVQNLVWQDIPVLHIETTSRVGLKVISNGWNIWLHKPDDTTMESNHFHVVDGPQGAIYKGPGQAEDEYKLGLGWQYMKVKVQDSQVLQVGTFQGFTLYFRRSDGNWQVAIPTP